MGFGISKDIIEDIRSRCDLVELIGAVVPLKRAGSNTYKGLCPFHQEKTPSFHVDAARQTYHCFGCGKGGDVFRFFMDRENVGFVDALHMLASRVGVVIPESSDSGDPAEGRRRADARERLYQINDAFATYFHQVLVTNPDSPAAVYLRKRGIPPEIAERFKIGAAPDDWTACLNYGRYLKFSDDELINSGIIRQKAESGRCFDHFKGRLTFAIENEQGRVVGFSARSLEPKPLAGGKYINTPETPIFKKGNLLYALPLARKMMSDKNMAILCEGQLDTIAFHRAGFACAVAPQGTGFTESQARVLKRYTSRIFLAFDADAAGQKAILRAVELLLPLSMEIKVIRIPGGKDPDELFSHGGAEAVAAAVEAAVPWLDVLCNSLPGRYDFAAPAGRGRAAVEVAEYLRLVTNQVELEFYVRAAAAALQVSEEAFWAELKQLHRRARRNEEFIVPAAINEATGETVSEELSAMPPPAGVCSSFPAQTPAALLTLLELAVNYEEAARQIGEELSSEDLPLNQPVARAVNLAIGAALNGEFDQLPGMISDLLLETPSPEISRVLVGTAEYRDIAKAVSDSVQDYTCARRMQRREELMLQLRQATQPEEKAKILLEVQQLNRSFNRR